LTTSTFSAVNTASKDVANFPVPVPDQEPKAADSIAEVHDQVAGLLGGPLGGRMCGDAEDVHRLVAISITTTTYSRGRVIVSR
jgi:hypothetical protein